MQLWYAAQLRLPRDMSRADKKARVNTVISALGLDSCKNTIVGGFFRKGISGGERKRTSVGHELLINPSLLLLDEPTRCISARMACSLFTPQLPNDSVSRPIEISQQCPTVYSYIVSSPALFALFAP